MLKIFLELISSFCYIGYLKASGTFATFATIPLVLGAIYLQNKTGFIYLIPLMTAAITVIAVPVSTYFEKIYGEKDPHRVVIDEVAGYFVTIMFFNFPNAYPPLTSENYVFYSQFFILSFLLFRACDIFKPFPANVSQKLPGGWGIVIDDIIAGIYANIILQVIFKYKMI